MGDNERDMEVEVLTNGKLHKTKAGKRNCKFDAEIDGERVCVTVWTRDMERLPGEGEGLRPGCRVHGKFTEKDEYDGKAQFWCSPGSVIIPDDLPVETAKKEENPRKERAANRAMPYGLNINFMNTTYAQMVSVVRRQANAKASEDAILDIACRLTTTVYISWKDGYVKITAPKPEETKSGPAEGQNVDVKAMLAEVSALLEVDY